MTEPPICVAVSWIPVKTLAVQIWVFCVTRDAAAGLLLGSVRLVQAAGPNLMCTLPAARPGYRLLVQP